MPYTEEDLRTVLRDHGETGHLPVDLAGIAERRGRSVRRRRRVAAGALAVGAVASIATAGQFVPQQKAAREPGPASPTQPGPKPYPAGCGSAVGIGASSHKSGVVTGTILNGPEPHCRTARQLTGEERVRVCERMRESVASMADRDEIKYVKVTWPVKMTCKVHFPGPGPGPGPGN